MSDETICPNCGALRPSRFCGVCGQNSRDYNSSFFSIVGSAIGEMFELDGRVVRSFRTIVIKPGQLSLAFAENRRTSFVNPFRLFMFTTILWFFLFGITFPEPGERPNREDGGKPPLVRVDLDLAKKAERKAAIEEGLAVIERLVDASRLYKFDSLIAIPDDQRRDRPLRIVAEMLHANPELPLWLQQLVANIVVDATYSPQMLLDDLIDNLPLMMFVLLPWYALLLMMFYSKQGKRFIHHLVFAIHVHSFSFILLSITIFTPDMRGPAEESIWDVVWDIVDNCLIIILMTHTYFAFKRFYGQSHPRTIVKYFSLGVLYSWGLVPAFALIILLSIAEYL